MLRFFRPGLIAVCMLMLPGCSMVDIAYNNAPSFVVNELDDAFDLSEAQNSQLDLRLEQFFAWHRTEEMDRYQQLLEQAALINADGITAAEFLQLNDDIRVAWRRSLEKAIDSLGDLIITLTPDQIGHYQQYFQEYSEEYADYLAKSEQQREIFRIDRSLDLLEDWYGKFDFDQEEKIRERLQQLPDIYQPWIKYREARQRALVAAFNNATEADTARAQLRKILLNPSTDFALEFEPARRSYWKAYASALEEIGAWLTRAQKQRVVAKLERYARAVERLKVQG